MSDETEQEGGSHVVVSIPTLVSEAQASDMMRTAAGTVKNGILTLDGIGECEMKVLAANGLMLADPESAGENGGVSAASMLAASSLVDSDVGHLNIIDSRPGISSPFQPSVIYVDQGDAQLSEQGLLLTTDSVHGQALSLGDHGDLMVSADVTEAEVADRLQTAEDEASDEQLESHSVTHVTEGSKVIAIPAQSAADTVHSVQQSALTWADNSVQLYPSQLKNLVLKTVSGESIQVIAVQNLPDVTKNRLVFGTGGSTGIPTQLLQAGNLTTLLPSNVSVKTEDDGGLSQVIDFATGVPLGDSLAGIIVSGSAMQQRALPPGTPEWATRINDCETIGDSYRGWVETEMDLDLLLTYHKQQTNSFWGTRQSPSPAKPSTRLMWKSQYVPFDGIPFINAGSRAIVLECQFGPRRKGAQSKRQTEEPKGIFKQTCPARIYIKKVKKFPDFAVDTSTDKKLLKLNMDKAFMAIRDLNLSAHGHERYYVQLPNEDAHEFHGESVVESPHRLDPKVANKIRSLVASGETRLYAIRKALRKYVEKELFPSAEEVPEKHNLTYYPTVNDLQNHIHQAVRDIESGVLAVTAPTVKVEVVDQTSRDKLTGDALTGWQTMTSSEGQPHTESVTVTLTQNPGEDGQHVISKVETHLSDGTTQVTTNLTPETARLLSKLHPNMFPSEAPLPTGDLDTVPELLTEATLASLHSSEELPEHMDSIPNAQTQYVVMETASENGAELAFGEGSPGMKCDQENSDKEDDTDLQMMDAKLDDDELGHYGTHCVSLGATSISSVVMDTDMSSTVLDQSMESTGMDKSIDDGDDEINVLDLPS